ncbi:MAG TPA: hypothetical protein VFQ53_25565 [Kofleriaceae bacterium]|nr:hypothetical protein [Kofleriaceae bacterium]
MRRMIGLALAVGCGGGSMPSEPRLCIATVTADASSERLEIEMLGRQPIDAVWSPGGTVSRWTYEYDERGRLVRENQDLGDDGTIEQVVTLEQGDTTVVEHRGDEITTYTLDADDRVIRSEAATSTRSLQYSGALLIHVDESIVDPELGPATIATTYRYDADRLSSRTVLDSRAAMEQVTTFAVDPTVTRTTVERPDARFTYTFDERGRTLRAEVDEDLDGQSNWVVEAVYAVDGTAHVESSRDGAVFRRHDFSAECELTLAAPRNPAFPTRPAAHPMIVAPAIPQAYD